MHVPVLNTAMVELRQALDGENIENTLYFRRTAGAWTIGQLGDLAELTALWHVGSMLPILSDSLTLRESFVTDLTTATSGVASYVEDLPAAGGISVESEANNIAAVVSIRTAKRGRANRGRNFIAGIPTTQVTMNTLNGVFANAIVDAYEGLRDTAATAGFEMVVVSRYSGFTIVNNKKKPTPRVTGLIEPVTTFSFTDLTVDSLRTRLPNH